MHQDMHMLKDDDVYDMLNDDDDMMRHEDIYRHDET